jgi:hypothetical protein
VSEADAPESVRAIYREIRTCRACRRSRAMGRISERDFCLSRKSPMLPSHDVAVDQRSRLGVRFAEYYRLQPVTYFR